MARYRKKQCRYCGKWITTNALGRASHLRACPGPKRPAFTLKPFVPPKEGA